MIFCKPCQDAGRERVATLRIDAEPVCARCARGESSTPQPFQILRPEPQLIRKPPSLPKHLAPRERTPLRHNADSQLAALQRVTELSAMPPRAWELNQQQAAALVSRVMQAVEFEFDLAPGTLRLRTNRPGIVRPRHLAMLLISDGGKRNNSVIGRAFGMHHTTVLHAICVAQERVSIDPVFAAHAQRIVKAMERAEQIGYEHPANWFQQQARRDSDLIREMKNVASLVRGFAPGRERDVVAEHGGVA